MTTEREALITRAGATNSVKEDAGIASEAVPSLSSPVEPGALEIEHSRLMHLQGQRVPDEQLLEEARHLVSQVRQLGCRLEDSRLRQHWQGILTYWSIYAYRVAHEDFDSELLPFDPELCAELSDDQYPYRFEEASAKESQEMLGWRRLLDECERDLSSDQLLTIVGDVGSGRKFLLHDLFLPLLRKGKTRRPILTGSENWRYIFVSFGHDPVRDLVMAVPGSQSQDPPGLSQQLLAIRTNPASFAERLEPGSDTRTMLAFSRFGSLLSASADDRRVVVEALAALLADPKRRYFLAITLRRRQIFTLSMFGPLEAAIQDGHVLLAFTTAELRHLIEEPARRIGLVFEQGLIDQIMIDIQGEPASLPLLQFTLARLWARRERNRITWNAYRKSGAGINALRIAMDEIHQQLSDAERLVLRNMLLAMVIQEPSGGFLNSEVSQADLCDICQDGTTVIKIIELLRKQSLLHERNIGDTHLLTLNDTALLRAWPPLVAWLDELQVLHRFRSRLREAATLWVNGGEHDDLLWRGTMLDMADRELSADTTLTTPERLFLKAGRRRQILKRRKRNLTIGAALLVLVAMLVAFPFALWHHDSQERRSEYARASLSAGDLPGALLWLNERKRRFELPFLGSQERDEKMRQLTQIQLPELYCQRFGGHDKAPSGDKDKVLLDNMVVSEDEKFLVSIGWEKLAGSNDFSCVVDVANLPSWKYSTLPTDFPSRKQTTIGCVAFLNDPSTSQQYLLATFGDAWQAWQVEGTDASKWRHLNLKLPAEIEDSSVTSLEAGGGLLAVSWTSTLDKRSLSLLALAEASNDQSLHLKSVNEPEGLDALDVRLVSLSSLGDLVVVSADQTGEANLLQAWTRTSDHNWTQATATLGASASKPNAKSLKGPYDCGWSLTEMERSWKREGSFVKSVSFSPSGNHFATASDDGQVLVWTIYAARNDSTHRIGPNLETELQLGSSVYDVDFLADRLLATGGRDRTARVWNLDSGTEILPRTYHEGTVVKVRFINASSALVTGTGLMRRMWRSQGYEELMSPCVAQQFAVSTIAPQVIVAISDKPARSAVRLKDVINLKDASIVSSAASPSGRFLCTTSTNGRGFSLQIRETSAVGQPHLLTELETAPLAAFSPDENWLFVVENRKLANATQNGNSPTSAKLLLWNLSDPHSPRRVDLNGSKLPAGVTFRQLDMSRYSTHQVAAIVGREESDKGEQRNPGVVYVASSSTDKADAQWSLKRLQIAPENGGEETAPHEEEVLCVGFSPAGDLLATGDKHDEVKVWNVEEIVRKSWVPGAGQSNHHTVDSQAIVQLKHSSDVKSLVFSPHHGALLATVSSEGEASLWSMVGVLSQARAEGKTATRDAPEHKLRHDAQILCVSFSPDGQLIVTGALDRTARVWKLQSARIHSQEILVGWELVGIFQHRSPVFEAWLPKEAQLMTLSRRITGDADSDNAMPEIHFWDMSQLRPWTIPQVEQLAARKISFSETEKLDVAAFEQSSLTSPDQPAK